MTEINGYYAERDGVKVIVMREDDSDISYRRMVRIAIDLLESE